MVHRPHMTSLIGSGRGGDRGAGWAFLRRAVRRPHLFGSPAPSGRALAAQLAGLLPDSGRPTVVELGAGTGALTTRIRDRLPAGSRLLAVELDEVLATHLAARLPGVDVRQGDAEHLPELLAAAGITRADAVVTSLPWTLLPGHRRDAALDAIAAALTPEGMATAVLTRTALPGRARELRQAFEARFAEVEAMPVVWRNVPPAALLVARRPATAASRPRPGARAS
jgi:phosphatidylethanolamine/phosphatidyl-N-methylethanolamine N-methyltransferase